MRPRDVIPRRELVTLVVYVQTGSHKAAAHRVGISESTSRQRVSQLLGRVGRLGVAGGAIEEIPTDLLRPDLADPRRISDDGREALTRSSGARHGARTGSAARTPTPGTG